MNKLNKENVEWKKNYAWFHNKSAYINQSIDSREHKATV